MLTVLEAFNCEESILKNIIGKSLESQNLDIVAEAAGAAQRHPIDDFMLALIAIANGTTHPELSSHAHGTTHQRAIYAIANNRTDEGVKALKALLSDTDTNICKTADDAIRQAYKQHPKYPEESDEKYTAALVTAARDNNNMWQTTAIIAICRSRTFKGVNAIKLLLVNPKLDIPIAETDAGVKAIRDLLRNKDQDIRKRTMDLCRAVYIEYPGRPMIDEDFPEEFRENPEEQKKIILEKILNR